MDKSELSGWMNQLFDTKDPEPQVPPDEAARRAQADLSIELHAIGAGGSNVFAMAKDAGSAARRACGGAEEV